MAMRTAVLKVHNPSRHKRAVVDYAFKQYSLAFDYLLRIAKNKLDFIGSECKFGNKISVLNVAA